MSLRGLFVLAVVLSLALALLYWVGRAPSLSDGGGTDLGTVLAGPLQGITAVEIGGGGARCRIERGSEGGWKIVSPISTDADPREVESFLKGLENARPLRVADEKASNLGRFGLEGSATTIRLEREKGTAPRLVRVGRHSPIGPERYTDLGDGRVLLVDFGGTLLERAPESFRERRLFPVEAESIRRIAVGRPAGRLVLAREGSSWTLTEPVRDLADYGAADGLARRVAGLAVSRYLADGGTASKARSGGEGGIVITVDASSGTAAAEIGPSDPEGERRASRSGSTGVGVVTESDVSDFLRAVEEFREHRPLLFSASDLRGVRIEGGGTALHVFREKEGVAWSAREGTSTSVRADGTKIDEMVDRIRWLRASRVTDSAGHPFAAGLTIELEGERGILGRLDLDRAPTASSGTVASRDEETLHARSSLRPGCLFEIPAAQLQGLPRRAADLTAPAAAGTKS